ncbi:MAG: hypothetical protein FIA97_16950 [Methylococcaceae bacterium]|nr:hypothetical protein [Methylococcaceae bacterium]
MISSFYAALATLLLVWLIWQVVRLRRAKKIRLGDGGDPDLRNAIRAHGNAVETIPLSLLLLGLAELSGAPAALLHAGGIGLLAGRVLHARGLLRESLRSRVWGMQLTVYVLIALALVNLGVALLHGLKGG